MEIEYNILLNMEFNINISIYRINILLIYINKYIYILIELLIELIWWYNFMK